MEGRMSVEPATPMEWQRTMLILIFLVSICVILLCFYDFELVTINKKVIIWNITNVPEKT